MIATLTPLLLMAALQVPDAGARSVGAVPADVDSTSAYPATTNPTTAGQVEVGPVAEVLGEHDVDVELRGSPESMARQHAVAVASDLSFMGTLAEMEALADEGELVGIDGGPHYAVMDWVFPFGIPEVRTFVERMAYRYRRACGEGMVVTSLTRPFSEQLPNSHQLSVHPAGMAIDLRVPQNPDCRRFLEDDLLAKEEAGLVDITHERAPPHYHVALFPEPYTDWVATQPDLPGVTATADPADAQGADDQDAEDQADAPPASEAWGVWRALLLTVLVGGLALGAGWWLMRGARARR